MRDRAASSKKSSRGVLFGESGSDAQIATGVALRRLADIDTLGEEIERTETALAEITEKVAAMAENPNVKLSDVMRKNAEQNDQRAYLRGLRFRSSVDELGKG